MDGNAAIDEAIAEGRVGGAFYVGYESPDFRVRVQAALRLGRDGELRWEAAHYHDESQSWSVATGAESQRRSSR